MSDFELKNVNRYEEVNTRIKLGGEIEGRDEKGIKKTVSALLKLLHPDGSPTDAEFDEYVAYAIEGRRRVKEQMNKRKPDDEFAKINCQAFWAMTLSTGFLEESLTNCQIGANRYFVRTDQYAIVYSFLGNE